MVEGVLVGPLGRTGGPTVEGSLGPKLKAGASWPKRVPDGPNVRVRGYTWLGDLHPHGDHVPLDVSVCTRFDKPLPLQI